MARQKRTSKMLEKAVRRAAGINSIDPNLDLGNGLTLEHSPFVTSVGLSVCFLTMLRKTLAG